MATGTSLQRDRREDTLMSRTNIKFALLACGVLAGIAAAMVIVQAHRADPVSRFQFPKRLLEARIADFPYSPLLRGRPSSPSAKTRETLADLWEGLKLHRTPAMLHGVGIAELALGKSAQAYALLREASDSEPQNASVLSDLAASELSLGHIFDGAEHSARSVEIDPTNVAAAFNWALALEKAADRRGAIAAWERYLRLDASSLWAGEAREHLSHLRLPRSRWEDDRNLLVPGVDAATVRRLVRKYPQRARARTQNILLPAWVEGAKPGELEVIRAIAAERASAGDPFLQDVVENAAHRTAVLREGFREYAEGWSAGGNTDSALAHYDKAAKLLAKGGSPLSITAAIYAASDEFYAGHPEADLARLDAVDAKLVAGGNRYPSMAAESAWARGLALTQIGQTHKCLESYRRSIDEARRAGEVETEVNVAALMAAQTELIADPVEAEQSRLHALRRLDEINAHPNPVYVAFAEAAASTLRSGRPHLSLAFVEEQAWIANQQREPLLIAESEAARALAVNEISGGNAAKSAIAAARTKAMLIPVAGLRDRTLARIDFIEGRILASADPRQAVVALSSALATWNRYGWKTHIANGYLARGEVALRTGDGVGAERDFRAGIAAMEEQRKELAPEPPASVAYFERADRLFDRLIELLIEEGRANDALSVVEHRRARSLLDRIAQGKPAEPLDAAALSERVGSRESILELAILDHGTEIWLIRRGNVIHARSTLTRAAVDASVKRLRTAIGSNDVAAMNREGRLLYGALIGPVASSLPDGDGLLIVPDGPVQTCPFAALVGTDGKYLIERYPLATVPSATVFLQLAKSTATDSLLGVAEPAPDGYEVLSDAAVEVKSIARDHRAGTVHIGAEITPEQFLAKAADADVIHFAGHSSTDLDTPSSSALLFEPAKVLTAGSIMRSSLDRHPVVVLAACGTGRGRIRLNEGVDSLASAFLGAGARDVVATLWDVQDAPTVNLFRSFHHNLRRGLRCADALRATQISLIHGENVRDGRPLVWSSTFVMGNF
jgi:CHAT domain-containing protein